MIVSGPSGFGNAPVTQVVFGLNVLLTLLTSFLNKNADIRNLFDLDFSKITTKYQFWRLLTSSFVSTSPSEFLFGLLLLYSFRLFERQFGSKKYAGTVIALCVVSMAFQLLALLAIPSLRKTAGGPYAIIFGLLPFFFADIPQTARFRLCGLPFSDKSFVYFIALQILMSSYPQSLASGTCGLIAGILYRTLPVLQRIRVPSVLVSCCSRFFGPLFSSRQRRLGYDRVDQHMQGPASAGDPDDGDILIPAAGGPALHAHPFGGVGADFDDGGGELHHMAEPPPPPPPPEAVAQLVALGFSEQRARAALAQSNNNVTIATNRLLDSHS